MALAQLDGRPWTFGDFFGGFQKYGSLLVYTLLLVACILPVYALMAIPVVLVVIGSKDDNVGMYVAAGVTAVPVIVLLAYIAVRVGTFGVPLILDRDCDGLEALKGSWRLTRGHVLDFILVHIVMAALMLAGVALLCVGFLFVLPFMQLAWAAGYLLIAGKRRPVE